MTTTDGKMKWIDMLASLLSLSKNKTNIKVSFYFHPGKVVGESSIYSWVTSTNGNIKWIEMIATLLSFAKKKKLKKITSTLARLWERVA